MSVTRPSSARRILELRSGRVALSGKCPGPTHSWPAPSFLTHLPAFYLLAILIQVHANYSRSYALFLMARSIPGPWIVDYLVDIAEEYGANLSAAPRKEKAMKAQLVKVMLPDEVAVKGWPVC